VPRTSDEFEDDYGDEDEDAVDAPDDPELPDESDMDDSDDPDVIECPCCRKSISEEAEWCHHCGNYLSREDAPRHVPAWVYVAAGVIILVVLTWLL